MSFDPTWAERAEDKARIAELEAEVNAAKKGRQFVLETMQDENDQLRVRIAELEAERDKFRDQVDQITVIWKGKRIRELEARIAELEAEREKLLTDVDGLTVDRDAAEAERDRLATALGETKHISDFEAAVLAEREACQHDIIDTLIKDPRFDEARVLALAAIRARPAP